MSDTPRPTLHDSTSAKLAILALRYAAGELPTEQADRFERQLASEQPAREALAEAVRLSSAATGGPTPSPDPLAREAMKEKLWPTAWTRLFPRRPYRGHPAAWAVLGGVAASALVTAAVLLAPADREVVLVPLDPGELVAVQASVEPSAPPVAPGRAPLTNPMDKNAESILGRTPPPQILSPMAELDAGVVPMPALPTTAGARAEAPNDPEPMQPASAHVPDPKKG